VHLAALAGVRPSIADPARYADVNVVGTERVLEACRTAGVKRLAFASSSSVYGLDSEPPFRESDACLRPLSPYAATKRAGELGTFTAHHLTGLGVTNLRFFTVYGPRQRPDLAIHKFARLILDGRPIPLYGDVATRRDYTYVGDIVAGIRSAMMYERTPFEVVNLGNDQAVSLTEMVRTLEQVLDRRAVVERLPEQPGDVPQTWANIDKARRLFGYRPNTPLLEGVRRFAEWMISAAARS